MLKASCVDPDLDRGDFICRDPMRLRDIDGAIHCRVRAPATWVLLDGDARLEDVQRIGPGLARARGLVMTTPVVDLEKALRVLEDILPVGSEASPRKSRRQQTLARAASDVHWLGHRTEIGLDA